MSGMIIEIPNKCNESKSELLRINELIKDYKVYSKVIVSGGFVVGKIISYNENNNTFTIDISKTSNHEESKTAAEFIKEGVKFIATSIIFYRSKDDHFLENIILQIKVDNGENTVMSTKKNISKNSVTLDIKLFKKKIINRLFFILNSLGVWGIHGYGICSITFYTDSDLISINYVKYYCDTDYEESTIRFPKKWLKIKDEDKLKEEIDQYK